jgi:hypothetical protein
VLRTGRRPRPRRADVAQLVAHHLAKVRVAGSNPVIRSKVHMASIQRWSGRVVRQRPAKPCTRVRFPSPPPDLSPARLAQRESASLTRKRSLVQSQYRAPRFTSSEHVFEVLNRARAKRLSRGLDLMRETRFSQPATHDDVLDSESDQVVATSWCHLARESRTARQRPRGRSPCCRSRCRTS